MQLPNLTPLAYWGLSSTAWIALWSVLATLTVVLIVLLRTRWSQAKPWRKCAILSLWVHVLLGCVATTVRIVTGAPELGSDTPIRVAVMQVVENEPAEPIEEVTPEWEQPADPPLIAPELDPLEAPPAEPVEELEPMPESELPDPAPPFEAPSLLEAPEQMQAPAESSAAQSTEVESAEAEPAEVVREAAEPNETTPTEPSREEVAEDKSTPEPSKPVEPPLPETYTDRFAKDREALVEKRGGSAQTERAVRGALGWLAASQSESGGWDASRFGAGAARMVLDQDRRGAGAQADTGVSGLALLAFLGAGHTHTGGDYTHEVAAGLEYLRQRQRSDGSLYGDAQFFARMYCHSMATFAVCEALALTKDKRLEPMARAAVQYTLSMQHPTDGGWRYQRGDTGDTSQLGWQMMTLKSAQLAGLEIPRVTWTRVDHFLRRVRRGQAGGLASYRPNSGVSRSMTAEALFCRQLQQEQQLGHLNDAALDEAIASVTAELPSASRRNLYFWYYATLALNRGQYQSATATSAWENWNHALTTTLITTQLSDGSWDTNCTWGGCGGRVYTTALSALCLEVYYRYNPSEPTSASPGSVAEREAWEGVRR